MRLSEKYGDRPAEELPLLFQRILQNATRDHFRRTKVRSFWTTLFSSFTPDSAESDNADYDPLETLEAQEGSKQAESAFDERGALKDERNQKLLRGSIDRLLEVAGALA